MSASREFGQGLLESRIAEPHLTLEVPFGWRGVEYEDALALLRGDDEEVVIDASAYQPPTAHGLVQLIRGSHGLDASPLVAVEVAGLSGWSFQALVTEDTTFDDNSGYGPDAGDRVTVTTLDHPTRAIVIFVCARADLFEALRPEAERLFRTMRFGPAA